MSAYSFKREAQVFVIYNGLQYNIDISEINFSQTFVEESYPAKTIQSQNQFENSVIYKANPANFNLTISAIREDDFVILFNRGLDCLTFDLYVQTLQDVFKIEKCVITNLSFLTPRNGILGLDISGEASILTREGDYGVATVPGTPVSRASGMTYNLLKYVDIVLAGTSIGADVTSINTELQNNISWLPNTVITGSCDPVQTLQYPTEFITSGRVLSGSITRYLRDDNNSFLQQWNQNTTLYMALGQQVSSTVYGFIFDIDNCSFTNRANTGTLFSQSYDWRLTQNPDSLAEIISYITLSEEDEGAILDHNNEAILDSNSLPILEST